MKRLVLVLLLAIIPVYAAAGPFGIEQGMKKEDLKVLMTVGPFRFKISPPSPHPSFVIYAVEIHPNTGVCNLVSIGISISTNVYGDGIRDEFENIRDQLSKTYGKSNLHDELRSGSIWNRPKDWMMALRKKERSLQAT